MLGYIVVLNPDTINKFSALTTTFLWIYSPCMTMTFPSCPNRNKYIAYIHYIMVYPIHTIYAHECSAE